ncbi:GNAT family N-acetyltransferase [Neolewinella agarilytica]|uniref:GNAT family N-acetyltransferase n=1 Tax=Neolewinella agarilytica TaxID=478744 RepID=UPI002354CCB8|nr:GNAT family protein [Neolewinella agarilytica]
MIRPLTLTDLDAFVALRAASFSSDPLSWDQDADSIVDPKVWADRIVEKPEEQFLLGYFMTDEAGQEQLAGLLGFQRYNKTKRRHRGMVWGVYVSPAARGQGAARQLLRECVRRAKEIAGLERLNLTVSNYAEAACKLYLSEGFREFGREKDAARTGDVSMDEVYMTLDLTEAPE